MLMLATILVLAGPALAGDSSIGLSCPEGFYLFGEKCYYIERQTTSFDGASHNCISSAEFASVESSEENEFLKGVLRTVDSEGVVGAYFGAAYDSSNGWGSFSDFTTSPAPTGDGLCPMFTKANDWAWTAVDCSTSADSFYICEMDYILRQCLENIGCYSFSPTYSCQADSDHLATILNADQDKLAAQFMKEAMQKGGNWGVLSGKDQAKLIMFNGSDEDEEGVWKVDDSDTLIEYTNWADGQPGNDPTENCLAYSPSQLFEWVAVPCIGEYNYLCTSEETSTLG